MGLRFRDYSRLLVRVLSSIQAPPAVRPPVIAGRGSQGTRVYVASTPAQAPNYGNPFAVEILSAKGD